MWENSLIWIVPVAIALHNLEEAIWLPAWSASLSSRWHHAIGAFPFRFAVMVLTIIAVVIATWAQMGGHHSLGFYLLAAYALGQGLNVLVPHLVAAIAARLYAPGLATGLFLVWAASGAFLTVAFQRPDFDQQRFWVTSGIFIPAMVLAIPVLFRIGRILAEKI